VAAVAICRDGSRIATGSSDGTARVWQATSARPVALARPGEPVSSVAFSPDGRTILTGSGDTARIYAEDANVRLWDASSGAPLVRFDARSQNPRRRAADVLKKASPSSVPVAFSPDGRRVVAAFTMDDEIRVFDSTSGALLAALQCNPGLSTFTFSPDGTRIVSGSSRAMLQIWDSVNSEPLLDIPATNPVEAIAFTLGGARLLSLA
jgi:Tol biopolymer transport system component